MIGIRNFQLPLLRLLHHPYCHIPFFGIRNVIRDSARTPVVQNPTFSPMPIFSETALSTGKPKHDNNAVRSARTDNLPAPKRVLFDSSILSRSYLVFPSISENEFQTLEIIASGIKWCLNVTLKFSKN
jgi:hypothetical protein